MKNVESAGQSKKALEAKAPRRRLRASTKQNCKHFYVRWVYAHPRASALVVAAGPCIVQCINAIMVRC